MSETKQSYSFDDAVMIKFKHVIIGLYMFTFLFYISDCIYSTVYSPTLPTGGRVGFSILPKDTSAHPDDQTPSSE